MGRESKNIKERPWDPEMCKNLVYNQGIISNKEGKDKWINSGKPPFKNSKILTLFKLNLFFWLSKKPNQTKPNQRSPLLKSTGNRNVTTNDHAHKSTTSTNDQP